MLNQFLIAYAEYGRFADQMGALSLSRQTFAAILEATQEDALIAAAKRAGKSAIPAYVGAMRGPLTLENVRELLVALSDHAHLFEFNEKHDNFGRHWTLVHSLGSKWSLFLANYFGEAFAAINVKVRHELSERNVTFWFANQ